MQAETRPSLGPLACPSSSLLFGCLVSACYTGELNCCLQRRVSPPPNSRFRRQWLWRWFKRRCIYYQARDLYELAGGQGTHPVSIAGGKKRKRGRCACRPRVHKAYKGVPIACELKVALRAYWPGNRVSEWWGKAALVLCIERNGFAEIGTRGLLRDDSVCM